MNLGNLVNLSRHEKNTNQKFTLFEEAAMTFNEVMALIMPSIIAFLFYSKVNPTITVYEAIGKFILFIMSTNCISYAILIYIRKTIVFEFTPVFTLKYCLTATFIAVAIAAIYRFIELNVNIKLKVESVDEKA